MSTTVWLAAGGGVLVLMFLWVIATYNGLVRRRNRVRDARADVDAALKQRYDVIPNLVTTVRGYAVHESATLDAVTRARAAALSADGNAPSRAAAESALDQSLRSLTFVGEAYPQLQASGTFHQLMGQLGGIEETLQNARRYYNGAVRDYNTARERIPTVLVSGTLGFENAAFFEAAGAERAAPRVAF